MRLSISLAALAGLLVATALIARHGFGAVVGALGVAGWGLALLGLFHLVPMTCSALGWRALSGGSEPRAAIPFVWIRWIREAVDNLLPVAHIGGQMVGARLLTFHGATASVAGAGVVVDMTMEVLSQFLFTLVGVALLIWGGAYDGAVGWILVALAVGLLALSGFVMAQRRGLFKLVERLLDKIAERWPGLSIPGVAGLHDAIEMLYQNPRSLGACCVWHTLSWILGAGEVWLALYLMGHPVTLVQGLVLESLGQAVRSAAFVVPGALGAQEGGYLFLGAVYGLAPEVALALSLAKRVRELLLGLPGLAAWQILEGKRLWMARR